MSTPGPKQVIYANLAEIAQALGHPHRLELMEHLAQGRRSVEELAVLARLTFANTSRHLQILRRARLVDTERRARHVLYGLAGEAEVVTLLHALGSVGERNLAEVRQVMANYFDKRDALAPVSREELLAWLHEGSVTLLDVRPEDEFALGHLPSAVNLPLGELEQRLSQLPENRDIVAYCRGRYCVLSFEVIARLRAMGYTVRRLEDGFLEWKAAGLDIEIAA